MGETLGYQEKEDIFGQEFSDVSDSGADSAVGAGAASGTQAYGSDDDAFGEVDISAKSRDSGPSTGGKTALGMPVSSPSGDPAEADFGNVDLDSLPPLGSSVGDSAPPAGGDAPGGEFNLPSPAAALGDLPGGDAPSPSATRSRINASGSTDFGEVDLGPSGGHDLGGMSLSGPPNEDDEFDAFPTKQEDESSDRGSGIALDDSPGLYDEPMGSLLDEPVLHDEEAGEQDGRGQTKFVGRRKLERQSRRTKIALLVVLVLLIAGGGSLGLTDLGPFGAFYLVELLPKTMNKEALAQSEKIIDQGLQKDTPRSYQQALISFEETRAEMGSSDEVNLLGVFLYYWTQVRFEADESHDAQARKLLGAIDMRMSEAPIAPLARLVSDMRFAKDSRIDPAWKKRLEALPAGPMALGFAQLERKDYEGALETAREIGRASCRERV